MNVACIVVIFIGPGGLCAQPVVAFASIAGHTNFRSSSFHFLSLSFGGSHEADAVSYGCCFLWPSGPTLVPGV